MTKERNKIVHFMTPRTGVLLLGHGHKSHYSGYVLSFTLSIYSTLIAIVSRDYDAELLYHRWFSFILWYSFFMIFIYSFIFYDFLYSMMGLLIYKNEPFCKEVRVKSLILRWLWTLVCLTREFGDESIAVEGQQSVTSELWKMFFTHRSIRPTSVIYLSELHVIFTGPNHNWHYHKYWNKVRVKQMFL